MEWNHITFSLLFSPLWWGLSAARDYPEEPDMWRYTIRLGPIGLRLEL